MTASAAVPADLLPRAIRELNTALKVVTFYPPQHPVVRVASDRFLSTLNGALVSVPEVELGFGEVGILHGGDYLPDSDKGLEAFSNYLLNRGVARLTFRRGVDAVALIDFLRALTSDPTRSAETSGLPGYLASRGITTIQVAQIDFEKILASEAEPADGGGVTAGDEKEAWKRLVVDFLQEPSAEPTEGLKTLLRNLATDRSMLAGLTTHLASSRDRTRLLARLGAEIHREAPGSTDQFAEGLGEALMKLDPRARMDLMLSRIPIGEGEEDLMERVTHKLDDPKIVELISSFIETEQQLSPRLFSVCTKVFAARSKTAPFFGAITAHLQSLPGGGQQLGHVWQSLQGLLVESDHDYLSETYRSTLEAISNRSEGVDPDLQAALETAPGYGEGFTSEAATDHAARVIVAALDTEPDPAYQDSLRDDLDRRSKKMVDRQRIHVLRDVIRGLAEPRGAEPKTLGQSAMDRRARAAVEQMVGIFRSQFERLTEEEKECALRAFQEVRGIVAPLLLDALADEENWAVRKGLLTALAALGRGAVPVLLKRLNDPSWFLVRNVVLLLGEIGGTTLVEPLADLLRHEEPRVRREAAASLGKIGGARAVAHLRAAILDPEVSAVAARVLGEIDRDSTVALFSRRLQRTGPLLRDEAGVREAITILGEMEAQEAVPALSRILNRGFWIPFSTGDAVRGQAARALRRIGTSNAMAAIEKATRSSRRSVRDTCESLRARDPAAADQALPALPPAAGASR